MGLGILSSGGGGGGSGGVSIGGLVTGGTTGSILFVGAASVLAQDNANLFWDDTNNRLGLGVAAAPAYTLDVGNNGRFRFGTAGGGNWYGGTVSATKWFIGTSDSVAGRFRFYSGADLVTFSGDPAGNPNFLFNQDMGGSSGTELHTKLQTSINGSSTHGYTILQMAITEAATGTGTKSLMDLQIGGTTRFRVERGRYRVKYNAVSADTTLDDTYSVVTVDASGAARTITLPASSGLGGAIYTIKKIDSSANSVTIDGNSSETIDGATTQVLGTQYASLTIVSDGTNWYTI